MENGATDVVIKYGYDVYGNVTSKTGGNDGRYTYTYDANGNITGRSDGRTLSWDYEGSCQELCVNSKKLIYKISNPVSKNDR